MKSKTIFASIVMLLSVALNAQTTKTLNGAVIDKYGNPIPGAVVSATNGAENTIVESDGTFSYEVPIWLESITVECPGMHKKKVKLNSSTFAGGQVVVKLRPKNGSWFVGGQLGMNIGRNLSADFNVMGGYIGNWGGYGRIAVSHRGTFYNVLGVTKHIKGKWYGMAGTFWGFCDGRYWKYNHYEYYPNWDVAQVWDIGVLYAFSKHMHFTANVTPITNYSNINVHLSVGIGYTF